MSDEDINRRAVLKKLGVSTAAVATFTTGTAAGEGGPASGEYVDRYEDRAERVRAVETHAGEVLSELAERGVVDRPSVAAFDLDSRTAATRVEAATPVDAWNAIEYTDPESGRRTDHLLLSKSTSTHNLTLHVRPRVGEAYAIVSRRGSDEEFAIGSSGAGTSAGVGTESCEGYCDCGPETCSTFPVLYEATYIDCIERDGGCQCYVSGTECGCDPLIGC